MTLSTEQLSTIAKDYWNSTKEFYLRQETSLETRRLQTLWDREIENIDRWKAFLGEMKNELPGFIVGNVITRADASLRCILYPPRGSRTPSSNWVIVGCVSILAPIYTVYGVECDYVDGRLCNPKVRFGSPPASMSAPTGTLARKIEATFGVSAAPPEITETPVPLFVEFKEPPHTTLFHALFTSEPGSIP